MYKCQGQMNLQKMGIAKKIFSLSPINYIIYNMHTFTFALKLSSWCPFVVFSKHFHYLSA